MAKLSSLGCLLACLALAGLATSCTSTVEIVVRPALDQPVNHKVQRLVSQLVSPIPAKYPDGYRFYDEDPDGPVVKAAKSIARNPKAVAAFKELWQMGPKIFPDLVWHLDDDRYSSSWVSGLFDLGSTGAGCTWHNLTVKNKIYDLISSDIHWFFVYRSRADKNGKRVSEPTFEGFMESKGGDYEWVKWAATKSRTELVKAFYDWCVEMEMRAGFPSEKDKKRLLERYKKELESRLRYLREKNRE